MAQNTAMRPRTGRRLGQRLGDLLFGGSCFLCRGAASALLCGPCDASLPPLAGGRCPRCALASPAGATCGRCLAEAPPYDGTLAALEYRFPCDALVTALKFDGALALAPYLGERLCARVQEAAGGAGRPDCIVPVPLSPRRLAERGFNPAAEIARRVAAGTGIRVALDACLRPRDAPAQAGLALRERRANVRGAFEAPRLLAGARIAVVDDVMTSGSTLAEVARALKRSGAAEVVNWVVARTPPPAEA